MSEHVDIAKPLREITARLGLVHECVGSLTITPSGATAEVFLLDEHGCKYIDVAADCPARETRTFEVKTG